MTLFLPSLAASAATFTVITSGGVLQQPTSHYYHACYGLGLEAASDRQSIIGRISYIERPEFGTEVESETGERIRFRDKDYGGFVTVGTKLTKQPKHGLFAYFGGGRVAGYIRTSNGESRGFALPGLTTIVEYQAQVGRFVFAAGHQTFAGYVDTAQLYAFVAWPYNVFNASMGYRW
jgi:hypothetical protein